MHTKQHTIKAPVSVRGVGLHTGVESTLTFMPAMPNHGFKFQRVDLPGRPIIDADVDNVVDVSRGTTIEQHGARVHTVEHTLAALVGMQIDNVLIQIDGPEPPILDGSSKLFIDALQTVGTQEQSVLRNFFEVPEGIFYKDADKNIEIAALPLNDYRLTVMIDYNSPVLGSQYAALNNIEDFNKEISSSRTFCFLHEIQHLRSRNLIKGGSLNNAIVVVDKPVSQEELDDLASLFGMPKIEVKEEGILNNVKMRHANEPARHKLLDLVGDLALAGRPLKAQILAARPGHAANVDFAKKLKKMMSKANDASYAPIYDPSKPPLLDINHISRVLPHRYPFQLVDKIIYMDERSVVGIKNVTMNENFFMGHFPGNPVMPGVLQVEALAQTGAILLLNTVEKPEDYWTYFVGIENCRFRKMVVPGDTLIMRCNLLAPIRRGIAKMKGEAFVGDKLVCEGELTASLVKKEAQ